MKIKILIKKIFLLLPFLLFITHAVQAGEHITDKDISRLKKYMSGFFSSAEQAKADTANYYEIHLHMYPFGGLDMNGFWLYVEQAMSAKPDKPYRQRIYHVYKENDTTIVSHVFTLKNPGKYIHAWKHENILNELKLDSLEDRKGCSIYLKKKDKKTFEGSTYKNECESNLRGAHYATSEVEIHPKMLLSWDRGFDKSGTQVWGATKGGYRFIKLRKTFN
jgi:hypothetical protein